MGGLRYGCAKTQQWIHHHTPESTPSRRGPRPNSSIYTRLGAIQNWPPVFLRPDPTTGAWNHTPESTPSIGRIEQGGRILPRKVPRPTSTPDQIPIRRRKPPPCKSKAPRDQRPPPHIYNIEQYQRNVQGGATVAAFYPKANFLFFFSFFFCFAWGLVTNKPTQLGQENHETTDGCPKN